MQQFIRFAKPAIIKMGRDMTARSFALALVLLFLLGAAVVHNTRSLAEHVRLVVHSHLIIRKLDDVLYFTQDVETGSRGYVLSGNKTFMHQCLTAPANVRELIRELRVLTSDNAAQQKRLAVLAPLTERKLAFVQKSIDIRERGDVKMATTFVATGDGMRLMDAIRRSVTELDGAEEGLLQQRDKRVLAITRDTLQIVVFGLLVVLALLLTVFVLLRREIIQRRNAEGQLDQFFTLSLEMLCIADANGFFRRLNPAFTQTLGWSTEEMLARPMLDFVHPDDHSATLRQIEKQVIAGEKIFNFQNRYAHKDGSWRILSWMSVPRPDGVMYAAARDVTVLNETADKIDQLNTDLRGRAVQLQGANQELEAFSYSVSHDLRAPLRHLDGFLELLQDQSGGSLDDKGRHYLETALGSARQMGQLIDDLLAFSRMGHSEMQKVPIVMTELVERVREELQPDVVGRKIHWTVDSLPEVTGDPTLIKQALLNLIDNAVKYTSTRDQAEIEIGTVSAEDPSVETPCTARNNEVVFFVRDNGVGFDKQYAGKLFGVFQRLHSDSEFKGTGIGLANVRRIITRHGGRTWAEGNVGEGAAFFFALPLDGNQRWSIQNAG